LRRFKKAFYRITGGRPMRIKYLAFVDEVSKRPVFKFTDCYGRWWLAEHRWSKFRVRTNPPGVCNGFKRVTEWRKNRHPLLRTFVHMRRR